MATDIKKVLSVYKIACNSHDLDKTISFFADNGILEDVALGIVCNGKEAVDAFYASMLADLFPPTINGQEGL
jgi:ketosteroid isomerase-like protein